MSKQPLIDQLDQAITRILTNPDVVPSSVDPSLVELLHVASDLRDLPRREFKARLRDDLKRKVSMSTQTVVVREGFRTVTPYLLGRFEDIEFIKTVFGAEETHRTQQAPGRAHVELRIGDSMLMFGVGSPQSMPTALHVHLPNSDEVYKRALAAGAVSLNEMIEDHGERFGCVQDPAGNQWYIATHLGAHYIPEHLNSVTTYFHAGPAASFIDFLKQAFSALEVARYDSPEGKVLHAKIQIGDSVVEVGEPHSWWQPMPSMMFLYVPDADAWYERATRVAGVKALGPLTNQPYGRTGGVEDPFGNQWYLTTPIEK